MKNKETFQRWCLDIACTAERRSPNPPQILELKLIFGKDFFCGDKTAFSPFINILIDTSYPLKKKRSKEFLKVNLEISCQQFCDGEWGCKT